MEEECKFDRAVLSSNKNKFSFTMSHKKMLGYVGNIWNHQNLKGSH